MPGTAGFVTADLERLNARVSGADWSDDDMRVWRELYRLGRDIARAHEDAERAGLVSIAGAIPASSAATGAAVTYRRSTGGTRATLGNMAPRP
jgi:hypothetical protein